ncbi:MAG: arylsulfatase [Raoultibacter sp.]
MLKRRLFITLFDAAWVMIMALYALLAFVTPAYAYVDPSVMTYAIQAFAGVAVALGAVLGVALRRTRKILFKVLKIDENARKEVEPDVHRLDAAGKPIDTTTSLPIEAKEHSPSKKRIKDRGIAQPPRWAGRIAYALIVSAFFAFTLLVVAPYEIVASNAVDLIFGLSDTWLVIAVPALVVTVCLALVLSLLRGRAFQAALLIVFSIGVAAYVQALLLNGALPAADGRAVVWSDYTTVMAVSALVWIALIVIPLVLNHWFSATCRGAAVVLSVCLVIVQAVGVASLFGATPSLAEAASGTDPVVSTPVEGERQITEEGLFEVAPDNNVIVLVLDTIDLKDFDTLLESDPSIKDRLDGFTYFSNTTGSMIPTRYAVPALLSGQLPSPDESIRDHIEYRYDRSTFLPEISDAGYSIGLYSDCVLLDTDNTPKRLQISDSTLNIHPLEEVEKSASLNEAGALRALWKCALYRDMPWPLKPSFWFYTDEVNNSMVNWSADATGGSIPYTMNDLNYYDKLKNLGLSVSSDSYNGTFKFIHLLGGHDPYTMDENGQDVGLGNSTHLKQCAGTFKIVDEYLNQLRELDLYDDATIIIMADHGSWYLTDEVYEPSCPIMIAKPPSSSSYASSDSLRISDVPASHLDFEATVAEAVGLDSAKYGTSLFALTDAPRPRPYYALLAEDGKEVAIEEFEINGNALDFSDWHATGNKWASGI